MKHYLITLFIMLLLSGTLVSCATSEERAAQQAETALAVEKALADRHYRIIIQRMNPRRSSMVSLSYGYSLEVKGDTLVSYLPYYGRAFNVPYGGGKGLNFTERIRSYQSWRLKKGGTHVELVVNNDEDTYLYMLDVFDNGRALLELQMQEREGISYDGDVDLSKKKDAEE